MAAMNHRADRVPRFVAPALTWVTSRVAPRRGTSVEAVRGTPELMLADASVQDRSGGGR